MSQVRSVLAAFLLIVLEIAVVHVSGQAAKRNAEWTPEAASLKGLSGPDALEKYTIRIPKGYEVQRPNNTPPGVRIWGWTGAVRANGSKGSLSVNLLTLPPAQRQQFSKLTLEQLAERLIGGVKRQRTNWKQEKIENGMINGVPFARIRWHGTDPRTQSDMRGFTYVARDGDTVVQLASQDYMPETDNALSLAEASVLTFQRK